MLDGCNGDLWLCTHDSSTALWKEYINTVYNNTEVNSQVIRFI
jgi:hypothetical protein